MLNSEKEFSCCCCCCDDDDDDDNDDDDDSNTDAILVVSGLFLFSLKSVRPPKIHKNIKALISVKRESVCVSVRET